MRKGICVNLTKVRRRSAGRKLLHGTQKSSREVSANWTWMPMSVTSIRVGLMGQLVTPKGTGMTNCHEFELARDENGLEVAEHLKKKITRVQPLRSMNLLHRFHLICVSLQWSLPTRFFWLIVRVRTPPPGIYSQTYCTCDHQHRGKKKNRHMHMNLCRWRHLLTFSPTS